MNVFVIDSLEHDKLRLGKSKFNFGPELLKRAKDLKVVPSFQISFPIKLLKNLMDEALAVSQHL
jgi:hypothetical protein